ncbi:unnamed protein product [Meganyctiphanes norvegica]|uniref:Peptidase S1 domain-containing protein n=1 Tax=Meganyctiphanes norvegica TaxID=48144 RepID=A0AAV2QBK9_MEGNR
MPNMRHACTLLLLVGACSALPQYPGQGGNVDDGFKQQQQQSGGLIPTAPVTSQCLSHQDCVPYFQCVDGVINTDGEGLLDLRITPKGTCSQPDYPDVPAICCNIPGVPQQPPFVEFCPFQSVCVQETQCHGTILDAAGAMVPYATGGSWSTCGNSNTPGVCCKPPHLDVCPFESQCVPEGQCHGIILDNTNNMVPYAAGGSWSTCGESNIPGVCCVNPPPIVNYCPGYKVCVSNGQCDAAGNVVTDGSGLLDLRLGGLKQCFVQQTTEVGLCCNPPTPPARLVLDTCPLNSVCMQEFFCLDKILDHTGALVPYAPGIIQSECALDGDVNNPGVCCLNLSPEYPTAGQCGVRNTGPTGPILDQRIQSNIAYNEAQFAEFPWQAVIFLSNFTFKCGASIIDNRWLLTAAHCVNGFQPYELKVRLGEWQVNTFDEPKPYVDVDVAVISIHPQFNPKNVHNDIAVLQLVEPVEFQYHINSICLPSLGQTFWGQRCIATGWGKDSFDGNYQHIMKKVELPTVEHQQCQNLLSKTRLGKYFQLDDSFMCAGGEDNKDACKGDGGGPLACQDPVTGQYVLTGITAFGVGCGTKDVPGVYADVQALLPFVQSVINPQQQEPIQDGTGSGYGK